MESYLNNTEQPIAWWERIIWRVFGMMMKKRGYHHFDGVPSDDGKAIKAFIFSSVPIEREYV